MCTKLVLVKKKQTTMNLCPFYTQTGILRSQNGIFCLDISSLNNVFVFSIIVITFELRSCKAIGRQEK